MVLVKLYLFIASIWFYQEYRDTKNLKQSFIIGLFWLYEVFRVISR